MVGDEKRCMLAVALERAVLSLSVYCMILVDVGQAVMWGAIAVVVVVAE